MKYDHWHILTPPEEMVRLLQTEYSPLLACALAARGIASCADAHAFLFPDHHLLHDPFLLPDMDKAAERIECALRRGECIAVYGDYDADGLTALTLVTDYLKERGGQVITHVPNRLDEGYGLHEEALHDLRRQGASLVVTVDTGVSAAAEVEQGKAMGLDFVITDHHACPAVLPDACAVVCAHRPDSAYPFAHLAGVGVAFKLVCALAGGQAASHLLNRYAALVALGSIADMVPLTDENRLLVHAGLRALETNPPPGLASLLQEAGVKTISAQTVAFALSPRINAAGRMGQTQTAQDLLCAANKTQAAALSKELSALNRYRQQVETKILDQALAMLEETDGLPSVLVLACDGWHMGVLGIVAAKLVSRFGRPVCLISLNGDAGKGSARSVPGFDVTQALSALSDCLTAFGGHRQAAGFSLTRDNIPVFTRRICDWAALPDSFAQPPALRIDSLVTPKWLVFQAVEDLSAMEPCGQDNPSPLFCLQNVRLTQVSPIGGGKHVRLTFWQEGHTLEGVYFGIDVIGLGYAEGELVDVAFSPSINTFAGRRSVQLLVRDIRLADSARALWREEQALFEQFMEEKPLAAEQAARLMPNRAVLAAVWRAGQTHTRLPVTMKRPLYIRAALQKAGLPSVYGAALVALEILRDTGLLLVWEAGEELTAEAARMDTRTDLSTHPLMRRLQKWSSEHRP